MWWKKYLLFLCSAFSVWQLCSGMGYHDRRKRQWQGSQFETTEHLPSGLFRPITSSNGDSDNNVRTATRTNSRRDGPIQNTPEYNNLLLTLATSRARVEYADEPTVINSKKEFNPKIFEGVDMVFHL